MPDEIFYPTWTACYFDIGGNKAGDAVIQGNDPDSSGADRYHSAIGFNSNDIRNRMSGRRITGASFKFTLKPGGSGTRSVYYGTHNLTSPPGNMPAQGSSSLRYNRFASGRVGSDVEATYLLGANVTDSAQVGRDFAGGVSTGILIGPSPSSGVEYDLRMYIMGSNLAIAPKLAITYADDTKAPTTPTLTNANSGGVYDTAAVALGFRFKHNDPQGYGLAGAYFWRVRQGVNQWWNGTAWSGTPYLLTPSQMTNVSGEYGITIPAGKWGNQPANAGPDTWRITTVSQTSGLKSPDSSGILLYASNPPAVTIQQPTGPAYRNDKPTLRWTFTDQDGSPQYGWIGQIYAPERYNAAGFNPDDYSGYLWSYSGDEANLRAVATDIKLENHKTYRAYMKVVSSPNPAGGLQYSSWTYSEFTVSLEPPPPRVTTPKNGSTIDLGAGFTLAWENTFSSEGGSQQQAAFAIRRTIVGSTYQWWNGVAWTATEFYASGANAFYSFRPTEVDNGKQYTFSVSIRDGYGLVSGYSAGATIYGSTKPVVAVVGPPAFITTVRPLIAWTMYDIENDPQQTYRVRIIERSVYNGIEINPLTAPAVYDSGAVADTYSRTLRCPVELLNTYVYRAYVQILAGGVTSEWSYTEFTVSLVPPATPSAGHEVIDERGAIEITMQGRDSMLTSDASRVTDGWTLVSSGPTMQLARGFTSSESGYMGSVTSSAVGQTIRVQTGDITKVAPSFVYSCAVTVLNDFRAEPVDCRVGLQFLAAGGTTIVAEKWSAYHSDAAASRLSSSSSAPGDALYVRMLVEYSTINAVGDTHTWFDPVLRPTEGVDWSPGGLLGTTTLSVLEGNDSRIVRKGLNIPIPVETQRVRVIDEEVPIGVLQSYEVIVRAVYDNDEILVSDIVKLRDVRWTSGWLWLSDPRRPGTARAFGPQSFDVTKKPARQGKFRPIGRADAVFTRGIRGLQEGGFTIVTHTKKERNDYYEIVEESALVLLRIPPDQGDVEGETLYVVLEGDLDTARPLPSRTPHRTITQTWTQQYRPLDGLSYGEDF